MFGVKSPVAIGSGAGAVFDGDGRGDAAADEEVTGHLDPAWQAGSDQIVEDLIRDRLVEGTLIAVGPEVEFQRFGLQATLARDVLELEVCKIGLTREWTEACELGAIESNRVVPQRLWVLEGLELTGWNSGHLFAPNGWDEQVPDGKGAVS